MRILVVGSGGVGSAFARIAARRDFYEHVVMADYDLGRAEAAAQAGGERFSATRIDASDEGSIQALLEAERCDVVLNAADPRFVMPQFRAALAAGATYLDMAMSPVAAAPGAPVRGAGREAR